MSLKPGEVIYGALPSVKQFSSNQLSINVGVGGMNRNF